MLSRRSVLRLARWPVRIAVKRYGIEDRGPNGGSC